MDLDSTNPVTGSKLGKPNSSHYMSAGAAAMQSSNNLSSFADNKTAVPEHQAGAEGATCTYMDVEDDDPHHTEDSAFSEHCLLTPVQGNLQTPQVSQTHVLHQK